MSQKKVLRVKEPFNDSIIAISSSSTAYIDEDFYYKEFGDKQNADYKAYPVNIVSLKINWIISTPEGKEFLQSIHQSERLDFYEIQTLQIIIEFLYKKCKVIILYYLLPLFLIQGFFFLMTMVITELRANSDDTEGQFLSQNQLDVLTIVVVVAN
jgi:hypothetical protein